MFLFQTTKDHSDFERKTSLSHDPKKRASEHWGVSSLEAVLSRFLFCSLEKQDTQTHTIQLLDC